MMTGPLRIVAHEATRTGAPAVLRSLLHHVRQHLDVPLDVRLRYGGPLADELLELSDGASDERPVAMLVNSSLAAAALFEVDPAVPAAVYVHEEGSTLSTLPSESRRALRERADVVFTVSERSRSDLIALGVPPDRLRLLLPVIAAGPPPPMSAVTSARAAMTDHPQLPLVVGCGETTWRKGPDLFIAVVMELSRHRAVRAAWIGRRFAGERPILESDVEASGLSSRFRWMNELDRPAAYLAAADVLVMTSREDPRPMVPMEAALVGTPTAGFAIGGLCELQDRGAAAVAPYPDVVALAEQISNLIDQPSRGMVMARRCATGAIRQQGIDVVGPQFVAELHALIGRATTEESES